MTTTNGDIGWIANYIWGIANDVLRDLYLRGKYRDVILPMTVLRRLDAVLEDTKQTVLDMKASLDAAGVVAQDQALRKARMGRGFTVMHIYGDELKQLVMPLPPLPEQASIARYIDHAERRITKYIRAKQKLIALWLLSSPDMDSYRVEKQAMQEIALADADAEIDPVPTSGVGGRAEADLDRLSNIIMTFNDLYGDIAWEDRDRVSELITETIPARVAVDSAYAPGSISSSRRGADEGRGNRGRRHGVRNARVAHCTDRFNNGRPRHRKIVTRCRHCRSPTKTPLR